jgi:hypothetical protein
MRYLLRHYPYSEVLYCDCDCYFAQRPTHLFEYLEVGGITLTPHWRPLYPSPSQKNFRLNFLDGLFNAGCVAADQKGLRALDWWALACESACLHSYEQGLYHDQRYLDLMPIYFPETVIVRHMGYNLADWNAQHRQADALGQRSVPDIWPVVLIHFTKNTIKKIESGSDPLLRDFYLHYELLLREAESAVRTAKEYRQC